MTIKGFNTDIIELYYITNLLQAKPGNKDIYHFSLYLICEYNLQVEFIRGLERRNKRSMKANNDVVQCIKKLLDERALSEDFIPFIKDFNKENDTITLSNIMSLTTPFLIKVLTNRLTVLLKNESEESEKEYFFKNCYGLDDDQIELIRFTYFLSGFPYGIFENDSPKPKIVINTISQATFIPYETITEYLSSDSKLLTTGIIQFNDDAGRYELPKLTYRIIKFIEGTLSSNALMNRFSMIDDTTPFPIESFAASSKHTNVVKLMLSSPKCFQILLYGEPGTGKTEYAKSIALTLGKKPRFILQGHSEMYEEVNRLWALHVTLNTMADTDLLIIDEADNMLNSERSNYKITFEKGQINSLFDTVNKSIIWITNDISRIHSSVLRRFAYSIRFDPMGVEQREKIWETVSKKYSITLSEENIRSISQRYNVNAAGIVHASNVASLLMGKSGDNTTSVLNEILSSHNELIHGGEKIYDSAKGNDEFNVDFLNTDITVDRVIKACLNYTAPPCPVKDRRGLCAIFYGVPGTGKSETARYIANQLNLKLIQKKYSELEGKYVGETEKNISRAFKEAEEQNGILFIDEADGFFTERTGDKRSWEISRTNEFLSQIDSYKGILICCTNLIELLDGAIFRRFAFKINFLPAKDDKRISLYYHFFGQYGELNNEQRNIINSSNAITPGDLRAVATSVMYEDNVTHELIIDSLKKECSFKNIKNIKHIGF